MVQGDQTGMGGGVNCFNENNYSLWTGESRTTMNNGIQRLFIQRICDPKQMN